MDHLKRPNDYSRYQTLHYIRYRERNFEAYAVAPPDNQEKLETGPDGFVREGYMAKRECYGEWR